MNDRLLFELIEKKQEKLNDLTFSEWRQKLTPNNWRAAIVVEIGEALDSLGKTTKWWKKNSIDIDNVRVELIDILHFSVSLLFYIKESDIEEYSSAINGFISVLAYDKFTKEEEIIRDDLVILSSLIFNMREFMTRLGMLFKEVGFKNMEEIFKAYMTKNVLNEFRQKHGYKEGTYIKEWLFKEPYGDLYWESKVEDNVVAYEIAKQIKADENFADNLYKELEKVYLTISSKGK